MISLITDLYYLFLVMACNCCNSKCIEKNLPYSGDLYKDYCNNLQDINLLSPENEKLIAKKVLNAKEIFYDYLLHNDYVLKFAIDRYESVSPSNLDTFFAYPRKNSKRLSIGNFREYLYDNIERVRSLFVENSCDYEKLINCNDEDLCFELSQKISSRTERGIEVLKEINFRPESFFENNHYFLENLIHIFSQLNEVDCDDKQDKLKYLKEASLEFHIPVNDFINYLTRLGLLLNDYKEVRDEFIKANLRLVISVARQLVKKNESFIDVIQDGNVGLIKAVDKYNPSRDGKFSTYATYWIRECINKARYDFAGRSTNYYKLTELLSKNNGLVDEWGKYPSYKKLAEETGIREKVIRNLMNYYFRKKYSLFDIEKNPALAENVKFIDSVMTFDNNLLEDTEARIQKLELILNEAFSVVDQIVTSNSLPEGVQVSELVKMYYGISPYDSNHTLRDLSEKFGISREGARQILVRYQNALEKYLTKNVNLDDLLPED